MPYNFIHERESERDGKKGQIKGMTLGCMRWK